MYIKVKSIPGAKEDKLEKIKADTFKISVKAKAERNLANQRIRGLLAEYFSVGPSQVRLIAGHHERSKIFDIVDYK